MSALGLYALLGERPDGDPGAGARGEPLRLQAFGEVLAAVGEMDDAPPAISAEALRAHDAAVRRLAALVDAALPFRFGSRLDDEAALGRWIDRGRAAIREALALVHGCSQMTLRVFAEGELPGETPDEQPDAPEAAGPGTRHLLRLRSARAQRLALVDPVREALAPWVRAERLQVHESPPLVATFRHLVRRGDEEAYRAAAARAAAERALAQTPLRLHASGPWPAYGFAPEVPA